MNIKSQFPIFENNPGLVYLDSGATTLKPRKVIDVMIDYYTNYSANIHRGMYPISEKATEEYEKTREKVKKYIGAKYVSEIIFTSGTTAGINLIARGWGEYNLKPGDEIVVTEMEHHSNLVPWQELAKRNKLKLKFISLEKLETRNWKLEELINNKTKILAITQVSNVTGIINPIKEIIKKARNINPEIMVVVDGAQAVAHMKVDVVDLDCDFYAFSGHKMYGPTGVGVLYAKASKQLETEPINFGGGMISEVYMDSATWTEGAEKFEAGTPPIAEVIGMGAAVDFLEEIGIKNIEEHEKELAKYALDKMKTIEGLRILGFTTEENRIGVISFVIDGVPAHDMGSSLGLAKRNIAVRSGLHCAMPLHKTLGAEYGSTRVSLGIYNNKEDIDRLVENIKEIKDIFISINEH